MADRMAGKVVMITGAAGGIGQAVAMRCGQEGARLVLTDFDAAALQDADRIMAARGFETLAVPLDVSDETSWQQAMAAAEQRFATLDTLVNNAGIVIAPAEVFEDITLGQWRRVMSVNLDGVFLGLRTAIPFMRRTGGGSIVNIGSLAAYVGTKGGAAYGSSKGGVRSLTKQAAAQCARNGENIRINAVHPSFVWTPLMQAGATARFGAEHALQGVRNMHPFGVVADPEDVANIVLFLACDESRLINGADLVADGGFMAEGVRR